MALAATAVVAACFLMWALRLRAEVRRYREQAESLSAVYGKVQANFEVMKRAERLSAIGQLSAGLAHEIRNPLASIAGAVSILQRSAELDAKSTRCLAIIGKESDRLNGLLTNFLNFARPRAPQFKRIHPGPLLENVLDLAAHAPRSEKIRLTKQLPEDLPEIQCDPEQLEQVLLNLLINAIEASPDGAEVRLSASPNEMHLQIDVCDQGPGVPASDVDHLFDPFFTTKEHGTGLGLPVAHQIIQQLGGTLLAKHNEERGMTFSVLLPLQVMHQ